MKKHQIWGNKFGNDTFHILSILYFLVMSHRYFEFKSKIIVFLRNYFITCNHNFSDPQSTSD